MGYGFVTKLSYAKVKVGAVKVTRNQLPRMHSASIWKHDLLATISTTTKAPLSPSQHTPGPILGGMLNHTNTKPFKCGSITLLVCFPDVKLLRQATLGGIP